MIPGEAAFDHILSLRRVWPNPPEGCGHKQEDDHVGNCEESRRQVVIEDGVQQALHEGTTRVRDGSFQVHIRFCD